MADLPHPIRTAPDLDGGRTSSRTLLVTVVQAAEILSLSRSSIYQLIWSDQLVPIRIGRSVRFSVDQLERFVAERASETLR
jgi:excisionase family DNA binding protein